MQPAPPDAPLLVTAGIGGLSVLLLLAWPALLARTGVADARGVAARFFVATAGWAGATLGLAAAGVFARVDARPPPFVLLPAALVAGVVVASRGRVGEALARIPLWVLVAMQGFRLPLELVMHQAALAGVMPAQMTFGVTATAAGDVVGCNYDLVTGVTALLLGLALRARTTRGKHLPRALLLGWNAMGTLLLLAVVAIGVGSTPLFALFGDSPARLNTWVLFPPFVWLPAVLVGSALLGHVTIFRRLLQ